MTSVLGMMDMCEIEVSGEQKGWREGWEIINDSISDKNPVLRSSSPNQGISSKMEQDI